jgi:hypothetical protein
MARARGAVLRAPLRRAIAAWKAHRPPSLRLAPRRTHVTVSHQVGTDLTVARARRAWAHHAYASNIALYTHLARFQGRLSRLTFATHYMRTGNAGRRTGSDCGRPVWEPVLPTPARQVHTEAQFDRLVVPRGCSKPVAWGGDDQHRSFSRPPSHRVLPRLATLKPVYNANFRRPSEPYPSYARALQCYHFQIPNGTDGCPSRTQPSAR